MDRPIALITGGTRGIGRAIADSLGVDHHILVGGTHADLAARVAADLPSAEPWPIDLTDPDAVAAACEQIDRLDVLIHSAGLGARGTVADLPRTEWRRVFELNVFAVADLTRALLPALRAAHGQVVMINSGAGFVSSPGGSLYAASKFALRALADGLREEERGRVRVTSIHPGRVDTDMQRELQASGERPYDPADHLTPHSVAATVRAAIDASPEAMVETLSIRPVVGPLR